MKKLLCICLAAFMLLSAVYCPSASAAVNYCAQFEEAINLLYWYAPYWDVAEGESFPVSSIMNYTRQRLSLDAYGEEPITDGNYTYYARYAIPADVFEAAAADFFDIVDINALRSYTSFFWDHANFTGIDNFQHYQEDRQVYLFSSSSNTSTSSHYQVMGYRPEQGRYRVYARFLSPVWSKPAGEEGIDYVVIGGNYYAVVVYLEAVLDLSNGRVQFCSWNESSDAPDAVPNGPLTVLAENETVTVAAAAGTFPAGATVAISTPEQDTLQLIENALGSEAAQFIAYDISASAQPNGSVQLSISIPQGFDENRLALYYIDEAGVAQRLHAIIDRDQGILLAELTHFSLYAVVELAEADPVRGDVNGDGRVNARDVRLILQYVSDLISDDNLSTVAADFNNDGKVNARDARLLLQSIAGLANDHNHS